MEETGHDTQDVNHRAQRIRTGWPGHFFIIRHGASEECTCHKQQTKTISP